MERARGTKRPSCHLEPSPSDAPTGQKRRWWGPAESELGTPVLGTRLDESTLPDATRWRRAIVPDRIRDIDPAYGLEPLQIFLARNGRPYVVIGQHRRRALYNIAAVEHQALVAPTEGDVQVSYHDPFKIATSLGCYDAMKARMLQHKFWAIVGGEPRDLLYQHVPWLDVETQTMVFQDCRVRVVDWDPYSETPLVMKFRGGAHHGLYDGVQTDPPTPDGPSRFREVPALARWARLRQAVRAWPYARFWQEFAAVEGCKPGGRLRQIDMATWTELCEAHSLGRIAT